MSRINAAILIGALLLGAAFYWLFRANDHATAPDEPVSVAELRRLAAALPGSPPQRIAVELTALRTPPGDLVAAGSGLRRRLVGSMAFRLDVPGSRPIVIDSGITAAQGRRLARSFDPKARRQVDSALIDAGKVLLTDRDTWHTGGLRALLSRDPSRLVLADALREPSGSGPRAVAPGVVVIPDRSSAGRGQMIFVRLGNGREYLFAGSAVPLAESWQFQRGPSHWQTILNPKIERARVFAHLHTVSRLKAEAPLLFVVPGGDFHWITQSGRRGAVARGFAPPASDNPEAGKFALARSPLIR